MDHVVNSAVSGDSTVRGAGPHAHADTTFLSTLDPFTLQSIYLHHVPSVLRPPIQIKAEHG